MRDLCDDCRKEVARWLLDMSVRAAAGGEWDELWLDCPDDGQRRMEVTCG